MTETRFWHLNVASSLILLPITLVAEPSFISNAVIGTAFPVKIIAFSHAALFSPVFFKLHRAFEERIITSMSGHTCYMLKKYSLCLISIAKGFFEKNLQESTN